MRLPAKSSLPFQGELGRAWKAPQGHTYCVLGPVSLLALFRENRRPRRAGHGGTGPERRTAPPAESSGAHGPVGRGGPEGI